VDKMEYKVENIEYNTTKDNTTKGSITPLLICVLIMLTVAVTSIFIRGYYLSNTCSFQMDKTLCYHKPSDTVYVIDPKGNPARIAPKQ